MDAANNHAEANQDNMNIANDNEQQREEEQQEERRSPEQERIEMERARMLLALNDIIVSLSVDGEIRPNRMTHVEWRPLCDAIRSCFHTKSLLFPRHGEHTMHLLHFICQQNFPEAIIREVIQRDPESVTSVSTPGHRRALHEACLNSPRNIRQLVLADPASVSVKDGNNLLPIEHYFGARIFDTLLPIHHPHVSHIELLLNVNVNSNADHNTSNVPNDAEESSSSPSPASNVSNSSSSSSVAADHHHGDDEEGEVEEAHVAVIPDQHQEPELHDIIYRRRSWFYLACKVWAELGNKEYDVSAEVLEDAWNIMLFVLRWLDHMEHFAGDAVDADADARNNAAGGRNDESSSRTPPNNSRQHAITMENYLRDFCPMRAVMRSKQYMALVGMCKGELWDTFVRRYRDAICTVDEHGDTMLLRCVQLLGCEEMQVSNPVLLSTRKRSVLTGFLDVKKESILISNRNGELPLDVALQHGLKWQDGTDLLLRAAPRAIKTRNVFTRLYPFMSAAIGERSDLGTIFELLREHPKMSAGLVQQQQRSMKRTRRAKDNDSAKKRRSCRV
mmetsp:Transcript_29280/g.45509  ORF Transcript_29280/g.45509 Transcript_29280/m.45509 type:complete len:561 (+) Transcript_29280:258-1940(+)|eukprot:CAMPEP_0196824456 /NCGR_PEP_ID=MMETSP1362-20130617/91891_1 /TAXON_ID=163516 /ORGANISM="Leptocylindrus danicus, Strain CCMP1856" /LENGTH=560 /DNA_ID=CAMNT_0042204717 /DNA_START=165 /DNA_END=1847 /DNA_ORIENTATION=+